jgi:hypothetical protein
MTISFLKPIVKKDFGVKRSVKRCQLTENLVVTLWQGRDGYGLSSIGFRLDRRNPKNAGKPFHTFHPQDLLEFPQLITTLAGGFVQTENVCPEVKWRLRLLAGLMEELECRLHEDDPYKGVPGSPVGLPVE